MTLQSASKAAVGTPDDQISMSLVQREAFLAKSRGVELSELQLTVLDASGKTLVAGTVPIDKGLDAAWAAAPLQDEAEAAAAAQAALLAGRDFPGLTVGKVEVTTDEGTRQLFISVSTADSRSANQSTALFMLGVKNTIDNLNADKGAQVALGRVQILDATGALLLNWLYDAQRGAQDWWQAPGMTTDWFECPPPAAASTAAE